MPADTPRTGPWNVRGVDRETRQRAAFCAERTGETLGAWLSRAVHDQARRQVQGEDAAPAPPPARLEDVADLAAQVAELRARLDAELDRAPSLPPPSALDVLARFRRRR